VKNYHTKEITACWS